MSVPQFGWLRYSFLEEVVVTSDISWELGNITLLGGIS